MATPHINANPGDFADTVLMPGDPLRAKFIADTFLEDAKLVTDVRNIFGYTGTYKGRKVSVMAHGMGIPSVSIYATELFKDYGVKTIIRIGTCGALSTDIKIRDIIVVTGASTDSKVNRMRFSGHDYAAVSDYGLVASAVAAAKQNNLNNVKVGPIFSADLFYTPDFDFFKVAAKYGVLAVEMEAAGLFPIAAEYGAKAGCILTVSDHIITGEATTSEERQNTFKDMMILALDSVLIHDQNKF